MPDMVNMRADIVNIDNRVDFDMSMALGRGKCSRVHQPRRHHFTGFRSDAEEATRFRLSHGTPMFFVSSSYKIPQMTLLLYIAAIDRVLRVEAAKAWPQARACLGALVSP
ncbi:MAG: hypothetical protein LLF96_07310 [Eubacteriales bacterium]|nr:hypothetical protein [Eubacteriales bacterium]